MAFQWFPCSPLPLKNRPEAARELEPKAWWIWKPINSSCGPGLGSSSDRNVSGFHGSFSGFHLRELGDDVGSEGNWGWLKGFLSFFGGPTCSDFRQMIRRKHRRKPGLCLVLPSKCTVSGSIRGTQMVNSVLAPLWWIRGTCGSWNIGARKLEDIWDQMSRSSGHRSRHQIAAKPFDQQGDTARNGVGNGGNWSISIQRNVHVTF